VVQAIDVLAEVGPGLGRPLVDTVRGSVLANLKELFVFDPWLGIARRSRSPSNGTRYI